MSVFQDLYHSEINFSVETFWDGGFDVKLGDPANGFVAETNLDRWGNVETWLRDAAIHHFPDSLFAQMYRDDLHVWLTHANPVQGRNGPLIPVETATEERTACLSRPDPSEKPGSSSGPATAAPGANPSQALGAPVEPGAAGANATAASFSGRE